MPPWPPPACTARALGLCELVFRLSTELGVLLGLLSYGLSFAATNRTCRLCFLHVLCARRHSEVPALEYLEANCVRCFEEFDLPPFPNLRALHLPFSSCI